MKKHEQEVPENHERWLISYADFITLLMVFFVIMYSISRVDSDKFAQIARSFSAAFQGTAGINMIEESTDVRPTADWSELDEILSKLQETTEVPRDINDEEDDLTEEEKEAAHQAAIEKAYREQENAKLKIIQQHLASYFVAGNMDDAILMHIDSRGLVISLNAAALFDPGKAEIKSDMADILTDIGSIIDKLENYIRVEGHTDNVPIGSSPYKSNWELSTARATNVIQLLMDRAKIKAGKLVAAGYSEYKPIASNDTAEGRSKNRRVDIIILSSKFNELEDSLIGKAEGKSPSEIISEG